MAEHRLATVAEKVSSAWRVIAARCGPVRLAIWRRKALMGWKEGPEKRRTATVSSMLSNASASER